MMNQKWKNVLSRMAFVGALAGACSSMENVANAAASCQGAGYLCFYDYSTAQYGNLSDSNPDWRVFSWNDRADVFRNDGTSHNACVYEHINYLGAVWFIPRNGLWYDVPDNTVSSNWWTTGSSIYDC